MKVWILNMWIKNICQRALGDGGLGNSSSTMYMLIKVTKENCGGIWYMKGDQSR